MQLLNLVYEDENDSSTKQMTRQRFLQDQYEMYHKQA